MPSGAFLADSSETNKNRIKRANEPSSSQLLFNRTARVNGLEEYIRLISNLFQDDPRVESMDEGVKVGGSSSFLILLVTTE